MEKFQGGDYQRARKLRSSYVPHGSLRAVVPDQPWTWPRRPYRGDIDDRSANLLFEKLGYNGGRAKEDSFDVDVEAFIEICFCDV